MSDAISNRKLELVVVVCVCVGGGDDIFRQPTLFECIGICVLSLARGWETSGSLVYLLVIKIFITSVFFFKIQPQCIRLDDPVVEFIGDF